MFLSQLYDMPLLEDGIFMEVYVRVLTYLLSGPFPLIFLGIMTFLALMTYILRADFQHKYDFWFLKSSQTVDITLISPPSPHDLQKSNIASWVFLIGALLCYIGIIFYTEGGVFSNYDIMHDSFSTGTWQQYGFFRRLNPLVFIDLTILYGITHNWLIINLYVIFISVFSLYMLWRVFDFIPQNRLIWILGLVVLSPVWFWTNHIVFTEKLMLIYICASFICIKNYVQTNNWKWILGFVFWMNVSIYTKETNLIFYMAITAIMMLRQLYKGNFTISSFIHPWRSMRQFPLETIMVLSIFIFVVQHIIIVQGVLWNGYLVRRMGRWIQLFLLYKFEILVAVIGLVLYLFKCKFSNFNQLIFWAGLATMVYVIGYLRLVAIGYTMDRSYYVFIPSVFIMIAVMASVRNFRIFMFTLMGLMVFAIFADIKIFNQNSSRQTYELADFISSHNNSSFMFGKPHYNYDQTPWFCGCWPRAMKAFNPNLNLTFKSAECNPQYFSFKSYALLSQELPESGDYYVVYKDADNAQDYELLKNFRKNKVFENKTYEVYQIE